MNYTKADLVRFNDKIKYVDDGRGCHLWMSTIDKDGFGRFKLNGEWLLAHRFVWRVINGAIPKGYRLKHSCNNKHCVNPRHLHLETIKKENAEDKKKRKRQEKPDNDTKTTRARKNNPATVV